MPKNTLQNNPLALEPEDFRNNNVKEEMNIKQEWAKTFIETYWINVCMYNLDYLLYQNQVSQNNKNLTRIIFVSTLHMYVYYIKVVALIVLYSKGGKWITFQLGMGACRKKGSRNLIQFIPKDRKFEHLVRLLLQMFNRLGAQRWTRWRSRTNPDRQNLKNLFGKTRYFW